MLKEIKNIWTERRYVKNHPCWLVLRELCKNLVYWHGYTDLMHLFSTVATLDKALDQLKVDMAIQERWDAGEPSRPIYRLPYYKVTSKGLTEYNTLRERLKL
jgi:hypothetical protein